MIVIMNAVTEEVAFITNLSHEQLAELRLEHKLTRTMSAWFPELDEKNHPTYWLAEPSALKLIGALYGYSIAYVNENGRLVRPWNVAHAGLDYLQQDDEEPAELEIKRLDGSVLRMSEEDVAAAREIFAEWELWAARKRKAKLGMAPNVPKSREFVKIGDRK